MRVGASVGAASSRKGFVGYFCVYMLPVCRQKDEILLCWLVDRADKRLIPLITFYDRNRFRLSRFREEHVFSLESSMAYESAWVGDFR